jgi:hypothetical protein
MVAAVASPGVIDEIAKVVYFLTVVVLGISAGSLVAEGAVLVPWWRSMPPESFLIWYSANASRLFDFFGPLEIVSALLAAAAGALRRYQGGSGSGLFIASAILAVAVLLVYPLYFQEVNAGFAAGTTPVDEMPAELARWAAWHWARTTIGIAAFAAAVLGVRATGADAV